MIIYVVANGEKMILHTFFIFRILSYKITFFQKDNHGAYEYKSDLL